MEDVKDLVLGDRAKWMLREIDEEWFKPHGQQVPPYTIKALYKAVTEEQFVAAKSHAHVAFLNLRMQGIIKTEADIPEPMSEETKKYLRELKESKKGVDRSDPPKKVVTVLKTIKKSSLPVWQDKQKQDAACTKYAWVVPGTFEQDPHKPGGSIVKIKCIKCGNKDRKIHLADAFQSKYCLKCKGK